MTIRPVVPGWEGVTFTEEQDDAWYMPSSVGSSYLDQVILEKYLKGWVISMIGTPMICGMMNACQMICMPI